VKQVCTVGPFCYSVVRGYVLETVRGSCGVLLEEHHIRIVSKFSIDAYAENGSIESDW
jgi:hypothetical protein